MKVSDAPVVVEHTFNTTPETVWRAISEPDLMRQWYFENIPDFKAEVGFQTRFDVESGDRVFPHLWRVTEVVPGERLAYDWKFEGYPGDSFVVWELFDQSDSTRLRLTVHVREDFPDDIPEFQRESCIGGWEYFIGQRLTEFLEAAGT